MKSWLWAVVDGELVSAPTNPVGAEEVVAVTAMPPTVAVEVLEPVGRGYAQVLRYWMDMRDADDIDT
ncbi:hypothetical protein F4560_003213 [Saccharothrix ecbatanensis]|uniref:Uncharacterized protein n=1 Tax=Saccharothrix ecbatanensis TaxID=1105145 RepID=A0A7W9HJN6_9PSEU|nr:hypothetical protein [Saccharothrix ecbatanensis]MBB5803445.1 hypothetical protein [Saccharothrix ecbatanensis]